MAAANLSSSTLDQFGHAIGKLRAVALPESDALAVEAQTFSAFLGQRIVKPDALNETAIATIARISHHYVVKRAPLGTASSKPDNNHSRFSLCSEKGKARILMDFTSAWQGEIQCANTLSCIYQVNTP
jgi:hypothetical protein